MENKLLLVIVACIGIGLQVDASARLSATTPNCSPEAKDVSIRFWKATEALGLSGVRALSMSDENIRALTLVGSSQAAARVTAEGFECAKETLIELRTHPVIRIAQVATLANPEKAAAAEATIDAKAERQRLLKRLRDRRAQTRL